MTSKPLSLSRTQNMKCRTICTYFLNVPFDFAYLMVVYVHFLQIQVYHCMSHNAGSEICPLHDLYVEIRLFAV